MSEENIFDPADYWEIRNTPMSEMRTTPKPRDNGSPSSPKLGDDLCPPHDWNDKAALNSSGGQRRPQSPRASLLRESERLICGKRQDEYGPPEVNFQRIADGWTWWFRSTGRDVEISPHDVASMMTLLKMARIANTGDRDGYADGAGYLAIAYELDGRSA